ncbi:MAG: DUF3565 domain-containing protein [Myxococcota bacterium]
MERRVTAFAQDDDGDWLVSLDCGHRRHVRHDPPWQERAWVLEADEREARIGSAFDCKGCDRAQLPRAVEPYKRTPEFDADSVPAGLTRDHRTAAGVWARIVVLEGSLGYVPDAASDVRHTLTPETPGIVVPELTHHVVPDGPVRFFVEFLRVPR